MKVPTVILGHRGLFCSGFANVETDDIAASHAVTKHLIDLGHRRIAYFTGPPVSPSAQERYEGYRRALREANIEIDDRLVFNAGSTIEEGEKAALQMLNENPKATAVQAVNDLVAIGVADVLLNQSVRIPEQVSVAGFGNILVERILPGAADDCSSAQAAPRLRGHGIDAVAPPWRTAGEQAVACRSDCAREHGAADFMI